MVPSLTRAELLLLSADVLTEGLFACDDGRTEERLSDDDERTAALPVLFELRVPDLKTPFRSDDSPDERRDTELRSPDFSSDDLLLLPLLEERTALVLLLRADPSLRTIDEAALLPLPSRELRNPEVFLPLLVLAYNLSPWSLKSGRE